MKRGCGKSLFSKMICWNQKKTSSYITHQTSFAFDKIYQEAYFSMGPRSPFLVDKPSIGFHYPSMILQADSVALPYGLTQVRVIFSNDQRNKCGTNSSANEINKFWGLVEGTNS